MSTAVQTLADEPEFDFAKAKTFAEAVLTHLNSASIVVMTSIGHKTGLFDAMAKLAPSTSQAIADAAGLNERYVREWLASLVMGRIVEYDPRRKTYFLPSEHAASLTRGGSMGNLAVYAQFMPMAGVAQDDVIEHFRHGGGTHYHNYPHFHDIMAEDSDQTILAALNDSIIPATPGLEARLQAGIDVLDVGCGKGHAIIALAERYPRSRFVGYDFEADAIGKGRNLIATAGLTNVRLEVFDMADFGEIGGYDLITTFDAVHDQKSPQDLIRGIHAALRPGGIYLMQDIAGSAYLENNMDMPMSAHLYAISCMHCMAISLGQGGEGLGTMWGWETAKSMLEAAGFGAIEKRTFEHDPLNVWFVSTRN